MQMQVAGPPLQASKNMMMKVQRHWHTAAWNLAYALMRTCKVQNRCLVDISGCRCSNNSTVEDVASASGFRILSD